MICIFILSMFVNIEKTLNLSVVNLVAKRRKFNVLKLIIKLFHKVTRFFFGSNW